MRGKSNNVNIVALIGTVNVSLSSVVGLARVGKADIVVSAGICWVGLVILVGLKEIGKDTVIVVGRVRGPVYCFSKTWLHSIVFFLVVFYASGKIVLLGFWVAYIKYQKYIF